MSGKTPGLRDWLSLVTIAVLWGSAFMLNEIALRTLSPSLMVGLRTGIAVIVLLLAMRVSGGKLPRTLAAWRPVLLMAVLGVILPFQLTAWGQLHLESGTTAVLMAIMPLFVLGLAHVYLPGERITATRAIGLVFGLAGVLCIVGPVDFSGGGARLIGMLAVLGAALSYSINSVYARTVDTGNPTTLSASVMLVAGVLTLPAAAADTGALTLPVGGAAIAAVLFLGLFCTGLASVLYFRLIQGPGPGFVSLVNYLIPAWAVVAGMLFLDEAINPGLTWGMALILFGVSISEFGGRVLRRMQSARPVSLQPVRIPADRR